MSGKVVDLAAARRRRNMREKFGSLLDLMESLQRQGLGPRLEKIIDPGRLVKGIEWRDDVVVGVDPAVPGSDKTIVTIVGSVDIDLDYMTERVRDAMKRYNLPRRPLIRLDRIILDDPHDDAPGSLHEP